MQENAPGTILRDRYMLERKIGSGGYGSVWSARDLRGTQEARVAVKLLGDKALANADARARFAREADVLLALKHPGIVRAQDFFPGDEQRPAFLVMEFIEGRSLAHHIATRTRHGAHYSPNEIIIIFEAICLAVDSAHAQGVIHRDIKPLNVMLVDDAPKIPVKVLDFGLAKLLDADQVDATTLGRRLGSFLYMAPEQAMAHQTTERTDIFALGTLLFELLTLRRAWARDDLDQPLPAMDGPIPYKQVNSPALILERIVRGTRPRPCRSRRDLPPGIDSVVNRALSQKPDARYPNVRALLSDARRGLGVTSPSTEMATSITYVADFNAVDSGTGIITTPDGPPPELTPLLPSPLISGAQPQAELSDPSSGPLHKSRGRPVADPAASAPAPDHEVHAARLPVFDEPVRRPATEMYDETPPAAPDTRALSFEELSAPQHAPLAPPPQNSAMNKMVALMALVMVSMMALLWVQRAPSSNAALPTPPPVAPLPASPTPPVSAAPKPKTPGVTPVHPTAVEEPVAPPPKSAVAEPEPTRRRSARRSTKSPRRSRSAPPPSAESTSVPSADIRALSQKLRRLEQNPNNLDLLEDLGRSIRRTAKKLNDAELIARINRWSRSAEEEGNIDLFDRCIRKMK